MSSLVSAELVATCNSLGYFDVQQNKYYADENTLESVKDLIRYLKRDDESHDIRRQLGETKVVQTDLLPLLKSYWEQTDLFDVLLRLLVNLTTPALMLWNEEVPTERTSRNQYLQIEEHLRLYKQAFTDDAVWAVLSSRISKILEVESAVRLEESGLIIERILILIRNILHVPADPDAEKRPDNDASVHDQVLWALHQSGMLDIILYVSSANEHAYYMHILEIMCYMLREQNAKELASAALQRSENEKMRDEAELLAIRHKETTSRMQKSRAYTGARHSKFGGTFVVKSLKSISDNELIYHKPLAKLDEINFDGDKSKLKKPKNRAPLKSTTHERRSAFSIRLFLKEFCVEFLNGAYNTFMYVVKGRLSRQQAQRHDETYYLWALRFFHEFHRNHRFDIKLVSETISVQTFQYVQRQLEQYSEMLVSDKKCVLLWAKRLHVALLAYKELIYTLCAMDKSSDEAVQASSKVIKSNIFYVLEYRELVLHLLINYNDVTMPREYLRDVIETQHVYMKMFQGFAAGKSLLVEGQAKKKKKAKKPAPKKKPQAKLVDLQQLWEITSDKMGEYLEGNVEVREEVEWKVTSLINERLPDTAPVKLSDLSKLGVQKLASDGEFEEAIALMFVARMKFPDLIYLIEDPNEQLDIFEAVFFTNVEDGLRTASEEDRGEDMEQEEDNVDDEEEEEDDGGYEMQESDLKFEDFSRRLAHPKIVRACALALAGFERNALLTNHCIVKLLHRIAFDAKMPTMLFQVSIFRVFQQIYAAKALPQHKELVKFATYIIRQFFLVAAKNQSVFMEALFWKSAREACDIEEGYASYNEKSKALEKAWSEHEEDELRRLFVEHRENAIERDIVDWIVDNLVDNTKTRRAVLKKLKEMYLLVDYKPAKKSAGPPKQWSDEEETQLRELFAQFADGMDPLTCIMERLDVRRPKNRIVEKILELGLVQDRRELRKKRAKGGGGRGSRPDKSGIAYDVNSDEDDLESSDSQSENEEETHTRSSQSSKLSKPIKKAKNSSKKKSTNKRKPKASMTEVTKMLLELTSGELKEGIDWLKDSLEDAAEDWNDMGEEDEGIPLVPILQCSIAAMENAAFLNLLRALAIQEPSTDGQEAYWRIPSSLSLSELQETISLVSQALEGTLTLEDTPTEVIEDEGANTVVDDSQESENELLQTFVEEVRENKVANAIKEAKNEKLRAMIKKMVATRTENDNNVELAIEDHEENNLSQTDDLDDHSGDEDNEERKVPKKKTKRIRIEDTSDEDEPIDQSLLGEDESNRMSFKPTRIRDYSDDEGYPNQNQGFLQENTEEMFKAARIIMESDDEDDHIPVKSSQGKTNILDSDDDDDNEDKENTSLNKLEEVKRLRSTSDSEGEKPKSKRSRLIVSDDED